MTNLDIDRGILTTSFKFSVTVVIEYVYC